MPRTLGSGTDLSSISEDNEEDNVFSTKDSVFSTKDSVFSSGKVGGAAAQGGCGQGFQWLSQLGMPLVKSFTTVPGRL